MRDYDERLHAPFEQRLGLLQLPRIISFGGLDEDVGVELLGAFQEQVAIALPAFLLLERVHQETDLRSRLLLLRGSWGRWAAGPEGDEERQEERGKDAGDAG